jgi:hexosaminidase
MKWSGNFWFLVVGLWLLVGCETYSEKGTLSTPLSIEIIPQPQELNEHLPTEFFSFNSDNIIYVDSTLISEFSIFKESLKSIGLVDNLDIKYHKSIPKIKGKNGIFIFLTQIESENQEEYSLKIKESDLVLESRSKVGISRGLQSIFQLIQLNKETGPNDGSKYLLPVISIKDYSQFKHRGLLLDCSRHFFEKDVVKKYIDLLALYKMNVLHWHLTEDQGWRIQIDKYPKLTEIGAWRTELDGSKYGGFYTKDEIREIIVYAEERHITVIPEIELPGHSQAAIAAYPHLSCTGKQVEVANDWGIFKEIYCAGNDTVFTFLEDVLTEVMELFPSQYIHIGGDEAPKFRWEHCAKCKARMKSEGLKDAHELQSYFISRIEKFLNKNGRQLIGWDEILEGGLSPHATVQSWRGMDGGMKAADLGHDVIMSPTSHCYLDYDLKAIDLEKVYNFNPVPNMDPENANHIIGGEVNMWTEHVPDENNLDSKVFPRLLAMSEVLWSSPQQRDYNEFYDRVQHHYPILKNLDVNYGDENVAATISSSIKNGKIIISPEAGNSNLSLKYLWKYNWYGEIDSGNDSSDSYKKIDKEMTLGKSGDLYIQAYKNDEPYGEPNIQHFENHNAIGKTVNYKNKYNQWYTAGGDSGLVDSQTGSLDFRDGNWQGFWGTDAELLLDLGELDISHQINEIAVNFYQYNNSWIFFPTKVEFSISRDGKKYEKVPTIANENISPKERGKHIETFRTKFETDLIRYIKIKATNIGKVPDWHEAAGSDAWIFMDEIIVK